MTHPPNVTAATVRHAMGRDATTFDPPVSLDRARQWAREQADGEIIYGAQFTHLDGSVSGM